MHHFRSVVALVALLSGVVVLAGPAAAQKSTYPDSMLKIVYEPRLISAQLQAALVEAKKAVAGYDALGPDDPIEGPLQAITNSYFLMRVALAGMSGIRGKKKFPDPVLDLAFNKIKQAWDRARGPIDSIHNSPARMNYIERSREASRDTVVLLEQGVAIWP
jgi:hypothetical protein